MKRFYVSVILLISLILAPVRPVKAVLPVIDVTNLTQNTITAIHQILAYATQIEQYATQIEQYKDQIIQATLQIEHLWQEVVGTMNQIEQVAHLFQNGDNLAATVTLYHDLNYWLNVPSANYTFRPVDTANQVTSSTTMATALKQQQLQITNDTADLAAIQGNMQAGGGRNDILKSLGEFMSWMSKGQLHQRTFEASAQQVTFSREAAAANTTAMQQSGTLQYIGTLGGPQDHVPW